MTEKEVILKETIELFEPKDRFVTLLNFPTGTIIEAPASHFKYKILSHNEKEKHSNCLRLSDGKPIIISWDKNPNFKEVK